MYIKVRILIVGDVISPQEVTAPVGIRYKGRRPQPSRGNSEKKFREKVREKLGSIVTEKFRVWLSLVELLRYLTSCRSLKQQQNYQQITQRDISTNISVPRN